MDASSPQFENDLCQLIGYINGSISSLVDMSKQSTSSSTEIKNLTKNM